MFTASDGFGLPKRTKVNKEIAAIFPFLLIVTLMMFFLMTRKVESINKY